MNEGRKVWAVVPAAGSGSRAGGDAPKQYHVLNGQCVIDHTLSVLLANNDIRGLVVTLAHTDNWWRSAGFADHERVFTTIGGVTRSESVLNGLRHLSSIGAVGDDLVVVHDAARPCLSKDDLQNVIEGARDSSQGALLATPVADTLKRADDNLEISATVSRDTLWRALTPQVFEHAALAAALESAAAGGHNVTDEAQAMELLGYRPRLVPGRGDNIKITHATDLVIAEAILTANRTSDSTQ